MSTNKSLMMFAKETANLMQSFVSLAQKNESTVEAFTEFSKCLDNVLDQKTRDSLLTLLNTAYEEISSTRGSEKSSSKSIAVTHYPTKKTRKGIAEDQFFKLLNEGKYTKQDLAKKLGVKPDTIRKRVSNLQKAGHHITTSEHGKIILRK